MDDRLGKDYERLVQYALHRGLIGEEEAASKFFQKLESLENYYHVDFKVHENYPTQLAIIKRNVAAALYSINERIEASVNDHSVPALIEGINKLKNARSSHEVMSIVRLGLSVIKEEKISL